MAFVDDINKPNLNKIVLVEMDIPFIQSVWINYKSGIWYIRFRETQENVVDDQGNTYFYSANVPSLPNLIGSCLVDSEFYTEVSSVDLVETTNKSWYYDYDNLLFYIHFDEFEPYLNQIVRIGVVEGYCQRNDESAYYNDVYYDPRVENVPSLTQRRDPLFFGIQAFQSGSITFTNTDGHFDSYNDLNIYGQPARIKVGFDGYSYSDFEQIFEGFIEDYSYDFNNFVVKIQDKRKNLSRKIPYREFSQNEYEDLNEDDVGKHKPIFFGDSEYIPVVCLNKDESAPTYRTFMFLDTFYGSADSANSSLLNSAFVYASIKNDEDDNIFDVVTINSIDVSDGTFDITASLVENDDGNVKDVFFTGFGYSETDDGIEMLTYLIDNFSDISYNSTFFNTTEISNELSVDRYNGYYIRKPERIIDIVGKIMDANDAYFYVQNDGLYSAKKYKTTRSSSKTIRDYQWISDPKVSYNTGDFLSSVTIRGLYHNARKEYQLIETNTSYEDEVLFKYKKYESKTFDTILSAVGDLLTEGIDDKAENIMLQSKDIVRTIKRTGDMSLYDIDLMDIITTSHKRQSEDELLEEWEVLGKTFDLTNFQITLEMKYWGEA